MKRFALFVSLAVGVAAAWEVSRAVSADMPRSGVDSDPFGPPNDVSDTPTALDTIGGFVASVFEPVQDVIMIAKNAVFGTKYDDLINSSAAQYGIPPAVLFNLLNAESRFRDDIITGKKKSPVGALGIAQFMPATAIEELGSVEAALDPSIAIPGAARYLAKLQKSLGGDLTKAVAAYNWGIGNVKRKGLVKAPTETRNYVASILGVKLS